MKPKSIESYVLAIALSMLIFPAKANARDRFQMVCIKNTTQYNIPVSFVWNSEKDANQPEQGTLNSGSTYSTRKPIDPDADRITRDHVIFKFDSDMSEPVYVLTKHLYPALSASGTDCDSRRRLYALYEDADGFVDIKRITQKVDG